MTGLLSPLLMGPPQSFQQGGGQLQQLLMAEQQMGQQMAPQQPSSPFQQMGQNFMGNARSLLSPEIALPMAGALMSGRTFGEGMGNALMLGGQGLSTRRQMEEEKAKESKTIAFLRANHPDLAAAVDAGMPAASAWTEAMKRASGGSDTRFGLNPIYGTDPETGETILGTMGNDGSFKRVDTGGFQISTGVDKIDAGTHWLLQDKRSGAVVGSVPKENYQEAFDKGAGGTAGKAAGEAQATYASMMSKMPGLEQVVATLDELATKATYTVAGQLLDSGMRQAGMEPREAAIARAEYTAIVDNQILPLLRDTFGAQFTQKEGETLRATLGDPNKSPAEKQALLKAFIEQKRRDIAALAQQAGQAAMPNVGAPPAQPSGTGGFRILSVE